MFIGYLIGYKFLKMFLDLFVLFLSVKKWFYIRFEIDNNNNILLFCNCF